ncbi:hypothetical protein AMTRI_Chr06g177340 [Amborella trichopoda]
MNTKKFHVIANARRRQNDISGLLIDDIDRDDDVGMSNAVVSHFEKAFTSEVRVTPRLTRVGFKGLSSELVAFLERGVAMEKVKSAIFSLHADKASGPDVMFKGSPTSFFRASRGLRQRDPLSPFLFTIYVKCFSLFIRNVEAKGHFLCFQMPNDGPCISHIQYADATLLFCDAKHLQIANISTFLKCCEVTLGLEVIFAKSSVVGINYNDVVMREFAEIMGCNVETFPIVYLGLPVSNGRLSMAIWDKVIQRIQVKLDLWKYKYLPLGGRITLVNACLSNLLIYQLSLM